MERCILSGKLLPDSQMAQTLEGPIGLFHWGRRRVIMDNGIALIPIDWVDRLREKLERDPIPESLEDGGKCLESSK